MPTSYLDALRRNPKGKIVLPYQRGWNEDIWLRDASSCDLGSDSDIRVRDFGNFVGKRCHSLWYEFDKLVHLRSVPALTLALVGFINANSYEFNVETLGKVRRTESLDQTWDLATTEFDVEGPIDILSDYLFLHFRQNIQTATSIVLPSKAGIATANLDAAVQAFSLLRDIYWLKNVFERYLFLGGDLTFSETRVKLDAGSSQTWRTYSIQNAIMRRRRLDRDYQVMLDQREAAKSTLMTPYSMAPYEVITAARQSGRQRSFDRGTVEENSVHAALAPLRGYVRMGYLFDTLYSDQEAGDTVSTWDILHSLSSAIFETNPKDGSSGLIAGVFGRRELLAIVQAAGKFSVQRARRALEHLTMNKPCRDGIWSRPLLPIDRDTLSIVHPALLSQDKERILHHFISNFMLASTRGTFFEERCRRLIADRTSGAEEEQFQVLTETHPIHRLLGIKKRQTDLIMQANNMVILGEAKSTSHVATPREFNHAMGSLSEGARQLDERLDRIRAFRDQAKVAFGLRSDAKLYVYRLLITNNTIFDGLMIGEAHVISLQTLLTFWSLDQPDAKTAERLPATRMLLRFIKKPLQVAEHEPNLALRTEKLKTANTNIEMQFDWFVCSGQRDSAVDVSVRYAASSDCHALIL